MSIFETGNFMHILLAEKRISIILMFSNVVKKNGDNHAVILICVPIFLG